ncbi:hypothetical protein [Pseudoduganella chitinolytica]|uniref:Uncharacterized protein n=1 Tax=Pseudoduganella chitinolytica TaxID=34070 RepID=A0ABY8BHD5_9BURK|nr:hypothetical protein [Pseudoduganella chitinolytica]WEF34117.1 hypothetical protein PX653_04930 [Pseudoduganella chitinolytica]
MLKTAECGSISPWDEAATGAHRAVSPPLRRVTAKDVAASGGAGSVFFFVRRAIHVGATMRESVKCLVIQYQRYDFASENADADPERRALQNDFPKLGTYEGKQ